MEWLSQNWYWILLGAGVLLLLHKRGMGFGMGGSRHASHGYDSRYDSHEAVLRDPVNGHTVDQGHALTTIFDGRTYYFESEESREAFNKDPQRFSGGSHRRHGGC